MFNIIIGLIFVIGGLTGNLTQRGLNSPELLAAIGAVMIVWGITQVVRRRRADAESKQHRDSQNPSPEFNPAAEDKL